MPAKETWFVVEVRDSILQDNPLGGKTMRFVVDYNLSSITDELRSVHEVCRAASDRGFEVRYASSTHPGVPPWLWNRVELKILALLRERLKLNVRTHAVSIDCCAVLTRYGVGHA